MPQPPTNSLQRGAPQPLTLDPVVGPPLPPIIIERGRAATVGRSSTCNIPLPEESVSRRHATIEHSADAGQGGAWVITDLGSRHGTYVNAVRLEPSTPSPLRAGDLVGIGPWTFRVRTGDGTDGGHVTTDDTMLARERVERVNERELAAITQNRLNLFIECAASITGAADEISLARTILRVAAEGTGYPRATLLREISAEKAGQELRVVADIGPPAALAAPGATPAPATAAGAFSRSLIAAARSGQVACLTSDGPFQGNQSIVSLGIKTALCAPISIAGSVGAYLYLDARAGESAGARGLAGGFGLGGKAVQEDAAAFCLALARLYGMALGNISRAELERRQQELIRDLTAAREAQRLIVPPDEGQVGRLHYAFRMKSGRYVAGDLFDVLPLAADPASADDPRVAVFLGDVAGKGISAAILMATAQTYLNAALRTHRDPARAVTEVNRYICEHAAANKFISLWLGVFDPRRGTLSYVDAGHGHWMLIQPGAETRRTYAANGIPLGIDPDHPYVAEEIPLCPDHRLVVFSDGVVEQPGAAGSDPERPDQTPMFGLDRAVEALAASTNVQDDVRLLFSAVYAFAGTESLADDTTVASIQCTP